MIPILGTSIAIKKFSIEAYRSFEALYPSKKLCYLTTLEQTIFSPDPLSFQKKDDLEIDFLP